MPTSYLSRRLATAAILPDHCMLSLAGRPHYNKIYSGEGRYVTEFDIGEFFIRGEAREVEGEFQAVIVMRAKTPQSALTYHQVEKDRWFKTSELAADAARESAQALKQAVDEGALKA